MRYLALALSLSFGVVACGDLNVNGDPEVNVNGTTTAPPAAKQWSSDDKVREIAGCSHSVDFLNTESSTVYCQCLVEAIEKKYSYEEFAADVTGVLAELGDNGQARECVLKADPNFFSENEKAKKPTKLKMGMSKAEVKEVFGEPDQVSEGPAGETVWEWDYRKKQCADQYLNCEVLFSKSTDTVIEQRHIVAKYLDLESF